MPSLESEWLILLLRNRLTAAWLDRDPGIGFWCGATRFSLVDSDARGPTQTFPAFFDRLHDATGSLVGIQLTPIAWWDLPLMIGHLSYAVAVDSEQRVQLFFGKPPAGPVRDMCDQAFGGGIYKSEEGEFGVAMDTYFLERDDVEAITAAKLDQAVVVPYSEP